MPKRESLSPGIYIKSAEQMEYNAKRLADAQRAHGSHDITPLRLYEKAAERRLKVGDFDGAAADYLKAYDLTIEMKEDKSLAQRGKKHLRIVDFLFGGGKLERTATGATALISILFGLFLLSPNITGNAIGIRTNSALNIIGSITLVMGILAGCLWFRKN